MGQGHDLSLLLLQLSSKLQWVYDDPKRSLFYKHSLKSFKEMSIQINDQVRKKYHSQDINI